MSRLNEDDRTRLTALLTQGDPAGEAAPTTDEMRQLRARILGAARESAPASRLRSVSFGARLTFAAVSLTVIALAVYTRSALWVAPAAPPSPGNPAPPVAAVRPAPEIPDDVTVTGGDRVLPPARPPREPKPVARVMAPVSHLPPSVSKPPQMGSGDQERPRQLHFIAPGGTRIVWTIERAASSPRVQQQEDPRCGPN